jgi:hypothetical protein
MEAARVCAERGHTVTLLEAGAKLGGQLLLAARATWRKDLIGIVDWYQGELQALGVNIQWQCYADEDIIEQQQPDIVIIATGGIPDTDFVSGGDLCLSVWDVLSGMDIKGSVLVYDDHGQHQGPSCADFLAEIDGVDVELITPDRHAAAQMGGLNYPIYLERFYEKGVTVTPDHRLKKVVREDKSISVTFSNEYGGQDIHRRVDHIVVEHGTLPVAELFDALRARSSNSGVVDITRLITRTPQTDTTAIRDQDHSKPYTLYRVGDAVSSRNLHAAIYDSRRLCLLL